MGVHLVRPPPPATLEDLRGARALSSPQDWGLWHSVWAAWLARLQPRCQWMATVP